MGFRRTVILLLMTSACKSNADKELSGESTDPATIFCFPPWLMMVATFVFALLVLWSIVIYYYSVRLICNNIEAGQNRSETGPIRPGGHRNLAMRKTARHQRNRESPPIPQRTMALPGTLAPSDQVPVMPVHTASQVYDPGENGLQRSQVPPDLRSKALEVSHVTDGLVLTNPNSVRQTSFGHFQGSSRRVSPGPHPLPSCYSNIPPLTENLPSRPFASGSLQKPFVDRKAKPMYMTLPVSEWPPPCGGGNASLKLNPLYRPLSDLQSVKNSPTSTDSTSPAKAIQLRPDDEEILPRDHALA